jgi:SAM-dependent methyltransferase
MDKVALRSRRLPGYCNICGKMTVFDVTDSNLRDTVYCRHCGSKNRQRQIAAMLLASLSGNASATRFGKIADIPPSTVVWIAETTMALQKALSQRLGDNCVSSEFYDPALASGETVHGSLHVDMQQTHFEDNSLDFILSSDVMEHVPSVDKALQETHRILKPGGCHIFTAPFYMHRFKNEERAVLHASGETEHLLPPWYHLDPLRPEGVLVFTVFAPELLSQLEEVGFDPRLCLLHSPLHGILGNNGIVVVARKAVGSGHLGDGIFPGQVWPPPETEDAPSPD